MLGGGKNVLAFIATRVRRKIDKSLTCFFMLKMKMEELLILDVFVRFEKLDITPKSAQKIKPVLEQWMKEAKGR